jgi:hypothetical protein
MKYRLGSCLQFVSLAVAACVLLAVAPICVDAQTSPYERAFPQSKAAVEKALKAMQNSLAGHLPVLEGFAKPGEHPLDRYQRGYYQATVQVSPTASGGSLVRVSTKVTAWYSDQVTSRSGYQLLISNGRLESDLLDQLAEQLATMQPSMAQPAGNAPEAVNQSNLPAAAAKPTSKAPASAEPLISAPEVSKNEADFSAPVSGTVAAPPAAGALGAGATTAEKTNSALQSEADSLEEILKNQAHPKNLVAVKKSGTQVVGSPSLTAKPLFLASLHDEFEMLDFNRDWVHIRISGLSRGWIWRNSIEMPEGIPDTEVQTGPATAADLYHVVREETAQFPGDWEPLRGKNVKIFSVQKKDENEKDAGPSARLEYAKSLLDKSYAEMAQKPQGLAGIVLIFDSADGGMIAATVATLQQWKTGALSDAALWHNCFFDPPETFDPARPSGSR